jgi:UDP-glucose 4-epimerase
MDWENRTVLVTGGCSFIGSHLVDALVERKSRVRVVDNLSSGKRENLAAHLDTGRVSLTQRDLLDQTVVKQAARLRPW